MDSFEKGRVQFWRASEEAFVNYEKGDQTKWELLKEFLHPKGPRKKDRDFNRLIAALRFVHELLPAKRNTTHAYEKHFIDHSKLPFDLEKDFDHKGKIAYGHDMDVYLLESKREEVPSYVLKVYFREHGETQKLEEEAKKIKGCYDTIRQIYKTVPHLIPQQDVVVLQDPHKQIRGGAVAVVQEYAGKNIQDFFAYSEQELLELKRKDPQFAEACRAFYEITDKRLKEARDVVDILGKNNLCVLEKKGRLELVFLDTNKMFKLDEIDEDKSSRIKQKIDFLETIAQPANEGTD